MCFLSYSQNSVLDLDTEEEKSHLKQDNRDCEEHVFLKVSPTIGRDIDDARAQLREIILKHEADIERIEQIVFRKVCSFSISNTFYLIPTMLIEPIRNKNIGFYLF